MKKLTFPFLLTVLMSMVGTSAFAHDFEVTNADGVTIYYVKTSDKTVAVSYRGYDYSSHHYTGNVIIPEFVTYNETTYSVTSIGDYAFRFDMPDFYISGLTSVTLPNSVTSIGKSAFYGCNSLTTFTLPNSVTGIGNGAFSYCSSLNTIHIPNSVTSIGDNAFEGCSDLTSVTIPNSVTSIGKSAFEYCSGLTSITIPNSLTYIGSNAFSGCRGLTSIIVESGNTRFDSRNDCNAIIETASNTLVIGCKATIIPNSVTSIGASAFENCSGLTSITIPNSVTSIGYSAFENCWGLTSVTIPNSVTSIGDYAFDCCSGLTSVIIGNSVTYIGVEAFNYCRGLTSVTIGNSVTSIGFKAFFMCTRLMVINCFADNPPTCRNRAFDYVNTSTCLLKVPFASISRYMNADPWKYFKYIESTAINAPKVDNGCISYQYYDLKGQPLPQPRKGANIVKSSDGKTRKVVVK